ncbi:50S ribosomal protein L29 [bacterium]|jgi:ribosomal protein L29|nr:50S ribosomal protein L29 [bacterium]
MKKEDIKKWRESTAEEIDLEIKDLEEKLYKYNHQLHIGQLKNFSVIKKAKRDIGVLHTLKNEKHLSGAKNGVKTSKES